MNNKYIIITGGTDGIGLAIVKNLLSLNNKIFVIGKNPEKGEKYNCFDTRTFCGPGCRYGEVKNSC